MRPAVDHRHEEPDLGHLVVQIARQLRKRRKKSLEPFGLAAHQARAFLIISRSDDRGDELRLSGLAARLRIAPRSATDVVDALETMDLVERRSCESDRRATQLVSTIDGRKLRRQLDEARADRSDEFFDVLTSDENATLRSLLNKVAAANEDDSDN